MMMMMMMMRRRRRIMIMIIIIAALRRPEGPPSGAQYATHIWETKGNPWNDFLMVIMASSIARGRVRTTAATTMTVESHNMAAILQITGWQRDMQPWFTVYFFGIEHPCYDQLTPVKTRYPLTSTTWPYRGLKLTAHRGQVFLKLTADQVQVFRLDRGLTCWKQGRIVRELMLSQD